MILYDLFIMITDSSIPMGLRGEVLKKSDLDFAHKKAVSSYRCLQDSSKISSYKHFIGGVEQALAHVDEQPVLSFLMNYLKSLSETPSSAIDVYEKLTQLFYVHLNDQDDLLAIAPLGRVFIEEPIVFAAFLRSLMWRDITPEQILSSHLLHDFFRYYLSTINDENNPVSRLYAKLNAYADTRPLSALAIQVRCDEGGLSSYGLDGSIHDHANPLVTVAKQNTPQWISPSEKNITALYELFEVDFLIYALYQWPIQKNHLLWSQEIKRLFNQKSNIHHSLNMILNRAQEDAVLQKALSDILNENTLSDLVEQHVGSVFVLMPYCPKLAEFIKAHEMTSYLTGLQRHASSSLAHISSLYCLFDGIKKQTDREGAVNMVFDALLDAVIQAPMVLDDINMISLMRKFTRVHACIAEKIATFEHCFFNLIQEQTMGLIEDIDFIEIETVWREIAIKIRCLQDITQIETKFPLDKNELYSSLLDYLFVKNKAEFNLDKLSKTFQIEALFDNNNVTPYERFILEIIATIDDENIRDQCVFLLNNNLSRCWKNTSLSGRCLIEIAASRGNIGLIKYLEKQHIKPLILSYDALTINSAKKNQWASVIYLHQKHRLKKNTVNMLLHQAIEQEAPDVIPQLWYNSNNAPDINSVNKALKLAVQQNKLSCVKPLLCCPQAASDSSMAQVFKQAIEFKQFQMAIMLAESHVQQGRLLAEAIEQTFIHAARLNQCDVLTTLNLLQSNTIKKTTYESALVKAARAGQLEAVQCITQFQNNIPRPHAIKSAWDEASKQQFSNIKNYLSTLIEPMKTDPSIIRKKRAKKEEKQLYKNKNKNKTIKKVASCGALSTGGLLGHHGFFQKAMVMTEAMPKSPLKREVSF